MKNGDFHKSFGGLFATATLKMGLWQVKWSVARSCHYFTQNNLFYIFRKELLLGTVHERQTKKMSQVASPDSKVDADYQQHQSHVDSQSNDVNLQVCRWLTVFVVM